MQLRKAFVALIIGHDCTDSYVLTRIFNSVALVPNSQLIFKYNCEIGVIIFIIIIIFHVLKCSF